MCIKSDPAHQIRRHIRVRVCGQCHRWHHNISFSTSNKNPGAKEESQKRTLRLVALMAKHVDDLKIAGSREEISKSALRRDVRLPPLLNRLSAPHVCCVGRRLHDICFAFSSVWVVLACSRKYSKARKVLDGTEQPRAPQGRQEAGKRQPRAPPGRSRGATRGARGGLASSQERPKDAKRPPRSGQERLRDVREAAGGGPGGLPSEVRKTSVFGP